MNDAPEIEPRHTIAPYQMRRVTVESPYAGDVERNVKYARACIHDCLMRGESPYASHLLLTQEGVLDDSRAVERAHGINAGLAWQRAAHAVVVYTDLGITEGMKAAIQTAEFNKVPIEYRILPAFILS